MAYRGLSSVTKGLGGFAVSAAAGLMALSVLALPADAQEKEKAKTKAAAGQAAAPKDSDKKQSAWVKLCEKAPLSKRDKDGKELKDKEGKAVKDEKSICLTHHERLDGNTGMVMVSAAIREIEGQDRRHLMIMVPLGMAIPPGIRAAVYSKEQWEKAAKNEKIDEKSLKPIELKFSLCHPAGCTAEIEASDDMVSQMDTGGGIMILAFNAAAQPIGFPVPLTGFTEAHKGQPVDNKQYSEARKQLMGQIRQRQVEMAEQFKKDQLKNLPSPPPDAAGAPAAKASQKK